MTTSNPAAEAALVPTARTPRVRGRRKAMDVSTVAVVAVVLVLLAILIIYPLIAIFGQAFSPEGMKVMTSVVTSVVNRQIVLNTFVLGILVGLIGTLLGFLLAYVQVKVAFKGKKVFHILCLLPVVSPPFAVATAVITLLGRRGIITNGLLGLETNIYGLPGLTLVLVLSFFPVAYMNFKGMLENLDPALDDASANLGASGWQTFWKVTLPLMVPGFAASFLLLFVEAIADLANPLVIGGDYTVLASRAFIAITARANPCGVWTPRSRARSITCDPASSTSRMVSVTGTTGMTASAPPRTASTTAATTAAGMKARAASWIRTTAGASPSRSARAARPAETEPWRSAAPGTLVTGSGGSIRSAAKASAASAGTTTTACWTPPAASSSSERRTSERPATWTSALGNPAPSREPEPAATTTATTGSVDCSAFI